MSRIFLSLALTAMLLLAANLVLGLVWGDFGESSRAFQQARFRYQAVYDSADVSSAALAAARAELAAASERVAAQRNPFWWHIWLGVIAALTTILVNCISITYFVGTSRWCREVVEAYDLPQQLLAPGQRLKRQSFPWALLGSLTVVGIAALGAASDPYSSSAAPADVVLYHWSAAALGTVVIGVSFLRQVAAVGGQHAVIQAILAAADAERGRRLALRDAAASS